MTGILYCKECGFILAVGGDKIEGTNMKHAIGTGKKTEVHEGHGKFIVKESYDNKKFKTTEKWVEHLQNLVDEKFKKGK